jgi:hypothetical protein
MRAHATGVPSCVHCGEEYRPACFDPMRPPWAVKCRKDVHCYRFDGHEGDCSMRNPRACTMSAFTPTPFRFTWRTTPTEKESANGWLPQLEQGRAFRAVRLMYGLTLRDVADGWRAPHVEVGELERGHRHFVTPADMQAAVSQLWLWAVEKNPGIAR